MLDHKCCHYYGGLFEACPLPDNSVCLLPCLPFLITEFGLWWLTVSDTRSCSAAAYQPCCTIGLDNYHWVVITTLQSLSAATQLANDMDGCGWVWFAAEGGYGTTA